MARGITQEDVFRACDALLIAGARPTIERVRQHLGTGSPNTVGPHLDSWFKKLGARIVDPATFVAQEAVPDPVQQAAKHLWEQALAQARGDFELRVREGLADAVANVEAEKERARIADAAAFEASGRATRLQAELDQALNTVEREQHARAGAEAQLEESRGQVTALKDQADHQRKQLQRAQESFSADLASAREATTVAETRADAASRHALLEIDQARQAQLKAERQRDKLQAELVRDREAHTAANLEQARATAQLEERLDGLQAAEKSSRQAAESAQAEVATLQQELIEGQREPSALRAEVEALRTVVAQMSASVQTITGTAPPRRMAGKASRPLKRIPRTLTRR